MVEEAALPEKVPRRMGRYDVAGVLVKRRSLVRSMLLIATARNSTSVIPSPLEPKPNPKSDPKLALSFSPLPATEATTTFQRPVAIKRIAPSLAGNPELVRPFLDRARVVTGIRHSNVVQIHEVGQSGGEVFLVMDYLMGETAATLLRRLHSRGETLDFTLAAHIIAEASAGLEAAHELDVLHEQLTPHDLFIGYDGTVRVLDIGIAAARSRMGGELGGVGLELEYASPERCKKEPLDRQTDVFSLGTMLWELNAGISPFERAKEADTIRAICEEPIVAPANVCGVPEEVSAITMQALARDKTKRYRTTLALRHALLGSVRRLALGVSPAEDLSRVMRRLFETRIRDKKEMLKRIESGSGASLAGLDIGELGDGDGPTPKKTSITTAATTVSPAKSNPPQDIDPHEPSVVIAPVIAPKLKSANLPAAVVEADNDVVAAGLPIVETATGLPSRRSNLLIVAWSVVAAIVIGGTALAIVLGRGTTSEQPTSRSSSTGTSVVMTTSPAPIATIVPVVPASTPTTTASDDVSNTPAMVDETELHIETVPTHATILIGGAKRGLSPIALKLPKSGDAVTVEIRHTGYLTLKERVVPNINQRLKLTLVAARGPATTGSAPYHKFE